MTATYDNLGVQFIYPENWKVTDVDEEEWPKTVTVQGPKTAFWSLHVYQSVADSPNAADEVVEAMREEYGDLELENRVIEVAGRDVPGVDMAFHCLDLVIRARVLSIETPQNFFVILCQAEDREFEDMETVFLAVTTSLLLSVDKSAS